MSDWRDDLIRQLEQELGNKIKFNRDDKFDLQLSASLLKEIRLAKVLALGEFDAKLELKSESYIWRQTGRIAIEYQRDGKPTGIAATKADWWVHELCDDEGQTVVYMLMPVDRLKRIARAALAKHGVQGGDRQATKMVLLNISDLLQAKLPEQERARQP